MTPDRQTRSIPRRCRKGRHDWFPDNRAVFTEVERCRRCQAPADQVLAEILEIEVQSWSQLSHLPPRELIRTLKQRVNVERELRGLSPLPNSKVA